jgi:hypothetical protein
LIYFITTGFFNPALHYSAPVQAVFTKNVLLIKDFFNILSSSFLKGAFDFDICHHCILRIHILFLVRFQALAGSQSGKTREK